MKVSLPLALAALSATASLLPAEPLTKPIGRLDIDRALVRQGGRPNLNWQIQYPKLLEDIVTIDDPGKITVKSHTTMEIRVVGVAFQSGQTLLPAALQTQVGSGSWQTLFSGTGPQVDPSEVIYRADLTPGTTIDFAATGGQTSGGWSFSANTVQTSAQLTHLRDGDQVPSYVPAYDQGTIESYLTQFVTFDSVVTCGPRDLIYLFELGTTNPDSSYFDMQDIAVVVTFKDVED